MYRLSPRIALLVCLAAVLLSGVPILVSADETEISRVPARIVAGKLVVSCDLSTRFRRVPVNLYLELETPCGLRLHNRAALGIRAENRDGSANPITIHLPRLNITVPRREHGPEEDYENFTKYHSADLGEVALVGTIGSEILKKYHLVFDLNAGFLTLETPRAESEDAAQDVEGTTTVPITSGLWRRANVRTRYTAVGGLASIASPRRYRSMSCPRSAADW